MAKALKTVGVIAGAAALAVTGVGLALGGTVVLAGTTISSATILGAIAGVANIGAQALAKPPPARGSVTDVILQVDPPSAYAMGEGYVGGAIRHQEGYGPTLDDVPNPYWWEVRALSIGGPVEGPIVPQFEFGAVDSWYSGFFDYDTKLGAVPDTALTAPFGTPGRWGADHKLSGTACAGLNSLFDKKGERFANGRPVTGFLSKWVKVYDPRQDSTHPGGSGPCRLGDEATYVWDGPPGANVPAGELPALHAGTYAFGRYQNGKRVFGMGLPTRAIDFEAIAAWANDCDANNWRMFGLIYESSGITPGKRWQNLRDICIAGSCEPLPLHTGIGFHWDRPRVVLDTITSDDLAGDAEITAMQSFRDRINTIVPEGLDPASNWELVKADPIVGASYLAEDGDPNRTVFPFNFVKMDDGGVQLGQLAAYKLANGRELYPITLPLMPRLKAYRPGDCLQLTIYDGGELVLDTPAVMLTRQPDPSTGAPTATFIGETIAKHPYALGETAIAPPTPALGQTAQERDQQAAAARLPAGHRTNKISGSYSAGLAGNFVQAVNGSVIDVTIPDHIRVYTDSTEVAVTGDVVQIDPAKDALLYYDDPPLDGGAVTYGFVIPGEGGAIAKDAYFSAANPHRHFIAAVRTLNADGTGGSVTGSSPPGGGGWDNDNPNYQQP